MTVQKMQLQCQRIWLSSVTKSSGVLEPKPRLSDLRQAQHKENKSEMKTRFPWGYTASSYICNEGCSAKEAWVHTHTILMRKAPACAKQRDMQD
jgi:hypothetical protein